MKRYALLISSVLLIFLFAISCNNNTSAKKNNTADVGNNIDGFMDFGDNLSTEGVLNVSESFIDFGTVFIHANPKLHSTRRIHLNNIGGGVLEYQTSTLINDFYFDAVLSTCGLSGGSLPALSSCVYVINFMPVSVSEPSGTIRITSKNETKAVKIFGRGDLILRGNINADYDQIAFPVTMIEARSSVLVTVKNTGSEAVTFKTSSLSSPFKVEGGSCALLNQRLGSNATCTIVISFEPTSVGNYKSRVTLSSVGGVITNPHYIDLNATAIRDGFLATAESEINFGLVSIGDSKVKEFTLKNIGTLPLNFITIIPDGFSDVGSTCNLKTFQKLQADESCLVRISFTPTRAVQYTDIIRFATNKGTNADIKLIAAGMDKEPLEITPTLLNFGTVLINTTSTERSVLIRNTARLPIRFDIKLPENFLYRSSSTCGLGDVNLQPDGSCILNISFNPVERKVYADNVILTHKFNTEGSVSFTVSGNGTVLGDIGTSPTQVSFGDVEVNTIAPIKVLTVTNIGGLPITVSTVFPTGYTATTGSCTLFNQLLNADESCTFEIRFNPTAVTSYDGNILMTFNGKQKNIPISGRGALPPAITFSRTPLTFADTAVGFTSAPQNFIINSVGGLDAIVTLTLPQGFERAGGSCTMPTSTIRPGNSCTLSIVFKPTAARLFTGNLSVSHVGVNSSIALDGLGFNPPEIASTPVAVVFNDTVVGLTSATQTLTLRNIGDKDATFSTAIPTFLRYNGASTCAINNQVLLPSASCNLVLEFTPTAVNNYSGNIQYTVVGGVSSTTAATGRGISDATVSSTPPSVAFGNVVFNTISKSEIVLQNTGGVATSVNLIFSADFSRDATSTCLSVGQLLNPGASCKVVIVFAPTATANYTGTLTVRYNIFSPISTRDLIVNLSGSGVVQGELSFSSAVLNFPQTAVGTVSSVVLVTAFNIGGGPIDVTYTMPANFIHRPIESTCGSPVATIPNGGNCIYAFSFKPTTVGDISETITFRYGAEVRTINATGKALAGSIANFNPGLLEFFERTINVKSSTMRVILSNTGDQILRYTLSTPTAPFTIEPSSTCATNGTLAPLSNCRIEIAFAPTALIEYVGTLTLLDTTKGTTTTLVIVGEGANPELIITPANIVFEDTKVNLTSSTAQVTIRNASNTAITFTRSSVIGYQIVTPPTGGSTRSCLFFTDTLARGESCIYNLQFRPIATLSYNGVMNFFTTDNTYELKLNGKGLPSTALSFSTMSLDFHETAIDYEKEKSIIIENTSAKTVEFDILMPIDFEADNNSTCKIKNSLPAYESCELIVRFKPDDTFEYATSIDISEKENISKIDIKAKSVLKGTVVNLYENLGKDKVKFIADDDNIFILNIDNRTFSKFNRSQKFFETLKQFQSPFLNAEIRFDNSSIINIKDNISKTFIQYDIINKTFETKNYSQIKQTKVAEEPIEEKEGFIVLNTKKNYSYLIDNKTEGYETKYINQYDKLKNTRIKIQVRDINNIISFKTSDFYYTDGNIYIIDNVSGRISTILP